VQKDEPSDAAIPASTSSDNSSPAAPHKDPAVPKQAAARLRPQALPRRASDSPFLAVALSEYLRIARTLASRIVRKAPEPHATQEATPDEMDETELHGTLARWGLNPAVWLAQLPQLDRHCTRAMGTAERVLRRAREVAQQRFHGIRLCRDVFAAAPSAGFT